MQFSPQSHEPLPQGLPPQSAQQASSPQTVLHAPSPHCAPQSKQQFTVFSPGPQQPSPQPLLQSQHRAGVSPASQQPLPHDAAQPSLGQLHAVSGKRHTPSPQVQSVPQF
jgi:hypothetical protein